MTESTSANTQEDNETNQQQFIAKVLQCMKTLEDKVDSLNAWKQQVAYQNDEVELHAHSDIEEGEDNVTQVRTTEDDVRSLVANLLWRFAESQQRKGRCGGQHSRQIFGGLVKTGQTWSTHKW